MPLTRRSLFALLAAAAADPERLIWQPGRKLISIPAQEKLGAWPPYSMLAVGDGVVFAGVQGLFKITGHCLSKDNGSRFVPLIKISNRVGDPATCHGRRIPYPKHLHVLGQPAIEPGWKNSVFAPLLPSAL